jgi:hypothetical protein
MPWMSYHNVVEVKACRHPKRVLRMWKEKLAADKIVKKRVYILWKEKLAAQSGSIRLPKRQTYG